MISHSNLSTILLQRCERYANSKDYCWFRISYAKIGGVYPGWVTWFEFIGDAIEQTNGKTLLEALKKLCDKVGI
jgi:hypothetical protein